MSGKRGEANGTTVARILEAARDVFAEEGFAGARVDVIARKAGVNKAALYYHIGDKKALYAQVIHNVIGAAAQRLAHGIEGATTPEDKMRTYLRTLARTFDENPQMPRIMMRELASGGQNLPGVFFQDLFTLFRSLSAIIEEGRQKGVFEETLPFMVHFMAIGATVIYKAVLPVIEASGQVPDDLKGLRSDMSGPAAREVEKLILKAIRK
jgi:TetR/AcrR family transcriptional regulator